LLDNPIVNIWDSEFIAHGAKRNLVAPHKCRKASLKDKQLQ